MLSNEIRNKFIKYFTNKNHVYKPSMSLIPQDSSLLFTNSGMVQFKSLFLNPKQTNDKKLVSIQKCIRAGGKHNDLENVGFTKRHHTFFEMLGNFSFGDYFKEQAIKMSWNFLTNHLNLPKEKLWVTIFKDDDEAFEIWHNQIGLENHRIIRLGKTSNFWQMGDIGPCGPSSEIFYDHGENYEGDIPGSKNEDGDRYVEIWNLVFMQYEKQKDGSLIKLPLPCVDTGMGLERISAVMQGTADNYQTDLFIPILQEIKKLIKSNQYNEFNCKVIADHIRSICFLIVDDLTPSNEGRGYVLRRIIRRALRFGNKLGIKTEFLYKLVDVLMNNMADFYSELKDKQLFIKNTIKQEETNFIKNLTIGLKILENEFIKMKTKNIYKINGELAFKLHDTYGFPIDLTKDLANENNFSVDLLKYDEEMNKQKQRSLAKQKFTTMQSFAINLNQPTDFIGYNHNKNHAEVIYLLNNNNQPVKQLEIGESGVVILNKTSFYAESGGQVGDKGFLKFFKSEFIVKDTQKQNGIFIHQGIVANNSIKIGDKLEAIVDKTIRNKTKANHTATHLLHSALGRILGDSIKQKGSLVNAEKLRFDFSFNRAITNDELQKIEDLVNCYIKKNAIIETKILPIEKAKQLKAKALFGEKYDDIVRVVSVIDISNNNIAKVDDNNKIISMELCGGTHVQSTQEIKCFKIISEGSIASGIRRIEALTSYTAFDYLNQKSTITEKLEKQLKVKNSAQLINKILDLLDNNKKLQKQIDDLSIKEVNNKLTQLLEKSNKIADCKILIANLPYSIKLIRNFIASLKNNQQQIIIVLLNTSSDKTQFILASNSPKLTIKELANFYSSKTNAKFGNDDFLAQGGGPSLADYKLLLEEIEKWIKQKLSN